VFEIAGYERLIKSGIVDVIAGIPKVELQELHGIPEQGEGMTQKSVYRP
jgi:hypothetical protein